MSINILDYQNDLTAKAKSVQIVGMEWEDVLQELYLHLLQVKHKYEPSKSCPRTFVVRVATNKIRDLIRRVTAQKRSYQKYTSLELLMEGGFDIASDEYGKITT